MSLPGKVYRKTVKQYNKLRKTGIRNLNKVGLDLVKDQKDMVFISTVGRSGSTLLMDLIYSYGGYRYYFEPFSKLALANQQPFNQGYYFHKQGIYTAQSEYLKKLFEGKIYTDWISKNRLSLFYHKKLIKSIRSNFYIAWIKQQYPDIKVIVLIRNPFAQGSSWCKMKYMGNALETHQNICDQIEGLNFIPTLAKQRIADIHTLKERLIFHWCLAYYIVFHDLDAKDFKSVFYERLIAQPEEEMYHIAGFIGENVKKEKWLKILKKPSITTRRGSEMRKNPGQLKQGWKKDWTIEEVKRAREIMSWFNMEKLYKDGEIPDKDDFYDCIAQNTKKKHS